MPDIEVTAIRPMPTEPELRAQLAEIETSIDVGNYRAGPWDKFIRAARNQPDEVRAALADDASRVSRKLHMRTGRTTMPVARALLLEGVGTVAGAIVLGIGVSSGVGIVSLLGALIWTATFQPLVKIGVGTWLGINNDYAYLERTSMEPRFKIRYGSYLAQPRWKRIVFHLAGIVGSPLGIATAAALMRPVEPTTAEVCMAIFWIVNAVNIVAFFGGLSGRRKLGPIRVATSSGGVAGVECREAWGLDHR
jgi:hypothetical protein